ncbi:MAG TPA: hypothetical protein VE084_22900 [Burkholderiaceae bacterium]|nr:hypothetical protein [Burkholderiaceae bacterium]
MTALNSSFHDAGLRIEFAVRSAVSSPVVPIRVNGKPAIAGVICRPHDCPVAFNFIAYPDGRLVGVYMNDARAEKTIGNPSQLERAIALQHQWQFGGDYALTQPAQTAQSGERVATPQMISVDQFHRIAAVGSTHGRTFAFSAFITSNTVGVPVLCAYSMGYGACSDRQPQTRVELDLPQSKLSSLYDARGSRGAHICALVELGSGGDRPRLTDFRMGECPTEW